MDYLTKLGALVLVGNFMGSGIGCSTVQQKPISVQQKLAVENFKVTTPSYYCLEKGKGITKCYYNLY